MKKIILIFFCWLFASSLSAQNKKTTYFNSEWQECEKNAATYYTNYTAILGSYEEVKTKKGSYTKHPIVWNEATFYINGTPFCYGDYSSGYYDGVWKRYYPNGELERSTTFINGTFIEETTYYNNGQIKENDKKGFYESGKLEWETKPLTAEKTIKIGYYEGGELHYHMYKENNKPIIDSTFYKDGNLLSVENYFNNEKISSTTYFKNGNIKQEQSFLLGKVSTKNYLLSGELQHEEEVLNGKIIFSKNYLDKDETEQTEAETFTIVEEMPKINGCAALKGEEANNCTNMAIQKYIVKNIVYPAYALENDIEGKELIRFVVDENGAVIDVSSAKGTNSLLTEAARRLVMRFPKFTPGYQRGVAVKVQYLIPINFKIS